MATEPFAGESVRMLEEEGLFARDVDGQLVRFETATESDYDKIVQLTVDGKTVSVQKAVPQTDAQGNIVNDAEGRTIPRLTTILDAANKVYRDQPQDRDQPPPIPTLCHQEHVKPVGVCRICSVALGRENPDGSIAMGKLVPACVHPVQPGMIVMTTRFDDDTIAGEVRKSVRVLLELLGGDHLFDVPSETHVPNELATLSRQFGVKESRFPGRTPKRPSDDSSFVIAVDHDQCILCDRCVRSCTEVKNNLVIGRSGKGYSAHIGFDLNDPMGRSSCVSCGECAINCPTGALLFKPEYIEKQTEQARSDDQTARRKVLTPEEALQIEIFSELPFKFLQFNAGSIVERSLTAGEVLCQEGEYGATAFLLMEGTFEVSVSNPQAKVRNRRAGGIWGWLQGGITSSLEVEKEDRTVAQLTPEDLIVGEMACLSNYPRSATVTAKSAGVVIEIRRNVLYMLQRNRRSREILNQAYRQNALSNQLNRLRMFDGLDQDVKRQCVELLREQVELIRVDPGQLIFRQGERADHFYLVRQGFIKVEQRHGNQNHVLRYLGPNSYLGEIGILMSVFRDVHERISPELLAFDGNRANQLVALLEDTNVRQRLPAEYRELPISTLAKMPPDEIEAMLPADVRRKLPDRFEGIRTATCSALDDVELVRVRQELFLEMIRKFPDVGDYLVDEARQQLKQNAEEVNQLEKPLGEFLEQGLSNAQRLLVLDLEACTRCDECTRACADTHRDANGEGVTRLIREGLRYDKFLVASSCRSCLDPYCMVGCPVDAIHRKDSMEITIEDNCIGCGQCATNCPYGNINMHGLLDKRTNVEHFKATTCDLCRSVVGPGKEVSCVYACPHEAAFRMSGSELLERVSG